MQRQCELPDCDGRPYARGYCRRHYDSWRTGSDFSESMPNLESIKNPCDFDKCHRPTKARGLCQQHDRQRQKGQDLKPLKKRQRGGSPYVDSEGYVVVRRHAHPNAQADGRILEHRLIMSEKLGRALMPGENAHHKNGVRDDNRPENLELWVTMQPAGQRPEDLLAFAHEIIERYETN